MMMIDDGKHDDEDGKQYQRDDQKQQKILRVRTCVTCFLNADKLVLLCFKKCTRVVQALLRAVQAHLRAVQALLGLLPSFFVNLLHVLWTVFQLGFCLSNLGFCLSHLGFCLGNVLLGLANSGISLENSILNRGNPRSVGLGVLHVLWTLIQLGFHHSHLGFCLGNVILGLAKSGISLENSILNRGNPRCVGLGVIPGYHNLGRFGGNITATGSQFIAIVSNGGAIGWSNILEQQGPH